MKPPKYLNGWPVRAVAPRAGGGLRVIVERSDLREPWVLASWHPNNPFEWSWGHYFDDVRKAEAYAEREFGVSGRQWREVGHNDR